MILQDREETVTDEVVASFAETKDDRLREIVQGLARQVGDLLAATRRSPMRPAHVHSKVDAPGHRTLITHVFAAGDPYLDSDAVFGVKESLVAEFAEHPASTAPDGRILDTAWDSLNFDIVLEARP